MELVEAAQNQQPRQNQGSTTALLLFYSLSLGRRAPSSGLRKGQQRQDAGSHSHTATTDNSVHKRKRKGGKIQTALLPHRGKRRLKRV